MDEDALTEGLYKGYLEALGDPYSEYYDAEETAKFNENMSGEFRQFPLFFSRYNIFIPKYPAGHKADSQ